MELLKNIKTLENALLDILTTLYFRKGPEVYLTVNHIKCFYNNDSDDGDYCLADLEIEISWGRYYENEEKQDLNEDHIDKLFVDAKYIDNYEFIRGMFAQLLTNH